MNANPSEPSSPPDAHQRHVSPWTTQQKIGRLLWGFTQATLFRFSPRPCYGWRRWLLRRFGAKLHAEARLRPTARIEVPWNLTIGANSSVGDHATLYCLGPITIGDRVTISQNAHLCAGSHDYQDPAMPLLRPPIVIEDDVWIAADAFVGPDVKVEAGAILGARGAAFKNLQAWTIYGGCPAKPIGPRQRHES